MNALADLLTALRALPPAAPEIDVETLARAAYEDRPPIGSRPVPWTPEKRRAWRAWAQRVARRLRYDLPDHAAREGVPVEDVEP